MTTLNHEKALRTLTVLYCEDEDGIRQEMSKTLGSRVKELYVGRDGEEGLRLFDKYSPDLIITDIKMPKINGLQMAETIRAKDKKVQIIMLTAFDYGNFLQKAIDIGVSQYVTKPIGKVKLFDAINRTVDIIMAQKKVDYQSMYIQSILDSQSHFVLVTDGRHIQASNKAFLKNFGYESLGEGFKDSFTRLKNKLQIHKGSYLDPEEFIFSITKKLDTKNVVYIKSAGDLEPFSCEVTEMEEIEGRYLVSLYKISDIYYPTNEDEVVDSDMEFVEESEETPEEIPEEIDSGLEEFSSSLLVDEECSESSSKDYLTGYYNQEGFYENLEGFLEEDGNYSFLAFSFKNYKTINKKLGYERGDEILKDLAELFKDEFFYEVLLVRFSGADFGAVIRYSNDEVEGIKNTLASVSGRINEELDEYDGAVKMVTSHYNTQKEDLKELILKIRLKHLVTKG